MRTFNELRQQLDEVTYKKDKKNHISSTKIKKTEVAYHAERKGSKKVRVYVKPKSSKEFEELGVFKDMKTAKKSAEQFVKLMGEDIDEGVSFWKEARLKAEDAKSIEIAEAKELDPKIIDKIGMATNVNDHNGAVILLAKSMREMKVVKMMELLKKMHKEMGHMTDDMIAIRTGMTDALMKKAKKQYSNYNDLYKAF